MFNFSKVCQAIAVGALLVMAANSWAGEITWIKAEIGSHKYELRQTNSPTEALKRMLDPYNLFPSWINGPTGPDSPATFNQIYYERLDNRVVEFQLSIAPELWARLATGKYELGDIEHDYQVMGWSGKCPDDVGNNGYVQIYEYGPMKEKPNLMILNRGELINYYQTHKTRIQTDQATLIIKRVDRQANLIEGSVIGKASSVKSTLSEEERLKREVPCNNSEFKITTESFNIDFLLEVKHW